MTEPNPGLVELARLFAKYRVLPKERIMATGCDLEVAHLGGSGGVSTFAVDGDQSMPLRRQVDGYSRREVA